MIQGQTLTASDGYQVALYPQTIARITQSYAGDTSHQCKGGGNSGLWDVSATEGVSTPIYAPFDLKVLYIFSGENNGNQVFCQSVNKVHYANGTLDYAMFGFGHDGIPNSLIVEAGKTYTQGTLIGHTGRFGKYVTGIHSHFILYQGLWSWSKSEYESFMCYANVLGTTSKIFYSPNPIDIDDLFCSDNTTIETTKINGITLTWKKWSETPSVVLTDNPITQTNNSNYNYIEFNSHVNNPKYSYWVTLVAGGEGQNIGNNLNNINQSVGSEWELIARVTGGIAWSSGSDVPFDTMNGILKKNWTWIEQYDDPEYDSLLALGGSGEGNTSLTFNLQSNMREYWGEWAITGVCPLNSSSGMADVAINSNTGHAFIGQKSDGTIFIGVSKSGTYGNTARSYFSGLGYTGAELDGGGSTFIQYTKGTSYTELYDNRYLKNAILVYRRTNTAPVTQSYTVNLTPSPSEYGTCKGSGTYTAGTTITIRAIPIDNGKFIKWSDNNTNAERTITVNSDIILTAYFTAVKKGIIINGYGGIDFQIL